MTSLQSLQEEVDRLNFVASVLLTELRRVAGESPSLSYLQKILAPKSHNTVVKSETEPPNPNSLERS